MNQGIKELQKHLEKNHLLPSKGCLTVAVKVLLDTNVQDEFVALLEQEYLFDDLRCERFGIDQSKIVFMFKCKPPKLCFVHPGIEVTYDHSLNQITNIVIVYF
ncbi:MAG: hypothetical protein AB7V56_06480 [Candidatus Nitrosocosmicus sp.]